VAISRNKRCAFPTRLLRFARNDILIFWMNCSENCSILTIYSGSNAIYHASLPVLPTRTKTQRLPARRVSRRVGQKWKAEALLEI